LLLLFLGELDCLFGELHDLNFTYLVNVQLIILHFEYTTKMINYQLKENDK